MDGQVGFVTGLCVGRMWVGVPENKIEPWRATGVEVGGPSVVHIELAFAHIWASLGKPIPERELASRDALAAAGDKPLRIVAANLRRPGCYVWNNSSLRWQKKTPVVNRCLLRWNHLLGAGDSIGSDGWG